MKSLRLNLCIVLITMISWNATAQNELIDSLKTILATQRDDTSKANTLNKLSMAYYYISDYANSIKYGEEQLQLSIRLDYKTGQGNAFLKLGNAVVYQNNPNLAFEYYSKALKIFTQIRDTSNIGATYANLSLAHSRVENYPEALRCLFYALKLYEQQNSKRLIGICFNGICEVYLKQNNLTDAKKYLTKAMNIFETIDEKYSMALCNSAFGDLNFKKLNYQEAVKRHQLAIAYFEQTKSYWDWAYSLNRIGNIYERQGQQKLLNEQGSSKKMYLLALEKYSQAAELLLHDGDKIAIAKSLTNQANIYTKLNKFKKAEALIIQSLSIAKLVNCKECMKENYWSYAIIDSINGSVNAALFHYKLFYLYHDSLMSESNVRISTIYKMEYENEKNALSYKLQQEKKDIIALEEKNNQRNIRNISFVGIALLILFGAFTYNRFIKRKKLSNQLSSSLTELKSTQSQLIQLEKEKEAEAIRLRISRDIHDEIGSNLTKIAMLGNLTSMQAKEKMPEVATQLETITNYAHQVNESMSEIIWAVNPKQDTLENLLAFMRAHTEEFLKDTGINYQINFPSSVPTIQLHPELKRSLFLVLKESLNNALKHASAKNMEVSFQTFEVLKTSKVSFEMKIKDDGVGFLSLPLTPLQRRGEGGNGLQNMQSRMQVLNMEYKISSSPGEGTIITVNGTL